MLPHAHTSFRGSPGWITIRTHLDVQLGRFVLVFCCDENFDFQAMGRIFVGLCQVGAWGCFDEFNRLEERILSAVSQQVQTIQLGLKAAKDNPNTEIEIVGKNLKVNTSTGKLMIFMRQVCFITIFKIFIFALKSQVSLSP